MPQVGHRSPHRREHFLNTHKGVLDGWIRFPVENVGNMRFIDFRIWSSLIFKYDLHWFSKWCSLIFHQEFQDLHCEPKDQIPQDSPALTSSASSFVQLSPWGWASWIDMGLSWDYHQVMGNPTFRWVDFWGLYGVSKGFLCDCYGFRMGKPTNIEDSMDWLCWGDLTQKPWFYTQNSWVFLHPGWSIRYWFGFLPLVFNVFYHVFYLSFHFDIISWTQMWMGCRNMSSQWLDRSNQCLLIHFNLQGDALKLVNLVRRLTPKCVNSRDQNHIHTTEWDHFRFEFYRIIVNVAFNKWRFTEHDWFVQSVRFPIKFHCCFFFYRISTWPHVGLLFQIILKAPSRRGQASRGWGSMTLEPNSIVYIKICSWLWMSVPPIDLHIPRLGPMVFSWIHPHLLIKLFLVQVSFNRCGGWVKSQNLSETWWNERPKNPTIWCEQQPYKVFTRTSLQRHGEIGPVPWRAQANRGDPSLIGKQMFKWMLLYWQIRLLEGKYQPQFTNMEFEPVKTWVPVKTCVCVSGKSLLSPWRSPWPYIYPIYISWLQKTSSQSHYDPIWYT